MSNIDNNDDVIDSRSVIKRIAELEDEIESARAETPIHTTCRHCGQDIEGTESDDEWLDRGGNASCGASEDQTHEPPEDTKAELPEEELAEEREELRKLKELAEEASGYSSEWSHGEALIRDSYFREYAEEKAEDWGAINRDAKWPLNHIDWKAAAEELQQDYTSVDFDGVKYWIRTS